MNWAATIFCRIYKLSIFATNLLYLQHETKKFKNRNGKKCIFLSKQVIISIFSKNLKTLESSSRAEYHAHRAWQFYNINRYHDCLLEVENALSIDPEHEFALALGILAFSMLKDSKRSLELGEDALKAHPDSEEVHFAVGTAHLRAGHPHPATRHLSIAAKKNPYSVSALINLSIALWSVDKKVQAENYLEQALSLDPENDYALKIRSQFQKDQNQLLEAIVSINKALSIDPEDSENHLVKGEFEMLQENYNTAASHFEEALRLNPSDTKARSGYLEAMFRTNQTYDLLNKIYPAPKSGLKAQLLVLVAILLLFNYFASLDKILSPPQIWIWLLLFPIFFFWVLKPLIKFQIYKEKFGEHPLELMDPALPTTLGAMASIFLLILYLFMRYSLFAWLGAGLVMATTFMTYQALFESPNDSVPHYENPWKAFWQLIGGTVLVFGVFYQLAQMS